MAVFDSKLTAMRIKRGTFIQKNDKSLDYFGIP
jgi:hypothetical protein